MFPNDILIGRPFKITHSDPQPRELAISKVKEAQKMCSLEGCCFPGSAGIYHISFLCFLRDKGFDYAVTNPIITKDSTNMDVRKLHNNKFDLKKAARVGLDAPLKTFIVPDDAIIDSCDLVRDYYYSRDLQSAIVLKLHAELKVFFPAYLNVFSKVTTQTSLELLEACPPTADMLAAPEDGPVEIIRSTARFGETHALARYDAICIAAKDVAVLERTLPGNVLRIRLYIKMYREHQAYLNSILGESHQAVDKLEGTPDYDRISFTQTLRSVGFLSTVVLITEMGSFDLFSSPRRLYAYFGLDPGVSDSGRSYGSRVHTSRRGSGLARRILYMVTINNLKVDKTAKTPVNPVVYNYYTCKCASKKKSVAVEAVMHKICNTTFTMFRDDKPFELITPEEHHERYAVEHPESVNTAA